MYVFLHQGTVSWDLAKEQRIAPGIFPTILEVENDPPLEYVNLSSRDPFSTEPWFMMMGEDDWMLSPKLKGWDSWPPMIKRSRIELAGGIKFLWMIHF